MQECARVCQSIPEYARQRRANNSVFEYYSNNIRIPKYSYSYSVDIFKPNNIRIRIRVIFSNRIIFVFVFGPQNTIRSPLSGILWHILAYSPILWYTLTYSGILWHTLAYSGILWHILAYSGILLHTLAYSGIL